MKAQAQVGPRGGRVKDPDFIRSGHAHLLEYHTAPHKSVRLSHADEKAGRVRGAVLPPWVATVPQHRTLTPTACTKAEVTGAVAAALRGPPVCSRLVQGVLGPRPPSWLCQFLLTLFVLWEQEGDHVLLCVSLSLVNTGSEWS